MVGMFPPQIGGISTYNFNLTKELRRKGHHVEIISYEKNDEFITHKAYHIKIPILRGITFFISALITFLILNRKNRFDVIHGHYLLPAGLVAVVSKKIAGTKAVVMTYGSDILVLGKKWYLRPILAWIMKSSDLTIVLSRKLKEEAIKMGIEDSKIRLAPIAIDEELFNPNIESNIKKEFGIKGDVILFVGALVKQKGLEYLIEACNILRENLEFTLIVVGDGPLRKELEKRSEGLNIIFTGFRKDVNRFMKDADILVLPSISEGLGFVVLESMAVGTPVLATKVGGIPELIENGKNGVLVEPGDPVALADGIKKLLKEKEFREKIIKSGFSKIRREDVSAIYGGI